MCLSSSIVHFQSNTFLSTYIQPEYGKQSRNNSSNITIGNQIWNKINTYTLVFKYEKKPHYLSDAPLFHVNDFLNWKQPFCVHSQLRSFHSFIILFLFKFNIQCRFSTLKTGFLCISTIFYLFVFCSIEEKSATIFLWADRGFTTWRKNPIQWIWMTNITRNLDDRKTAIDSISKLKISEQHHLK